MPTFDIDRKELTASKVDGTYPFKQYFEPDEVCDALELYYNKYKYRFEVPDGDLNEVRQVLYEYFFHPSIKGDRQSYCVVKQKDSNYGDVLKNSVLIKRHSDHIIFLMEDQLSVEQTIEYGATPLSEADIHVGL